MGKVLAVLASVIFIIAVIVFTIGELNKDKRKNLRHTDGCAFLHLFLL